LFKAKTKEEFCSKIHEMLEDEQNAQGEYFGLLGQSPEIDIIIDSIMKDEKKHYDALKKLDVLVCLN